jgi:hypothetical protein
MSFRYSDKVQLRSGPQTAVDVWSRFPANAQPITSAPQLGSQPVKVFDPSGKSRWALYHCGAWRGLAPQKDFKTGQVRWAMDGSLISQAVAWASS